MATKLFVEDMALVGDREQPLYLLQGYCEGRATVFEVDEEFYYIRCPFSPDLNLEVSIRMPVSEEQYGSWIAFVRTKVLALRNAQTFMTSSVL